MSAPQNPPGPGAFPPPYGGQPPYVQPHQGQPQYGQPSYPVQPAPPGPPVGQPYGQPQYASMPQGLVLTTKYFPLAWILAFLKPKVAINGQLIPAQWGANSIPLPPGQHHVHVHVPYFLPSRLGPADLMVNIAPQQTVPLEYRAPMWAFSPGSMGAAPQSYNGVGLTIAMMIVPFALLFLMLLLMVATTA
ncbi:MAG: hypothetical protein QM728_02860 [Gordonia sp. (in: high G+C Gram-positive bacteria)]|uniref:hypothetical protein n=1 Tax=Gordonia sp. (in: high G+C Gram-positive bacteria) TaxID=84139 RepID=UPI0039E56D96